MGAEEIAEKSGFSQTTVRRRVKMMELNQDVLKEVSSRQLSLGDFDRLAQIADIKERNTCLEKIGTSDFNHKVEFCLRQQRIKQYLPVVKKLLREAKAKKLTDSESWSSKYNLLGSCVYIADWNGKDALLPQKVSGKLYYKLEEGYGHLYFYEESKRPAPVKRPAAEIEREKRIAAVWAEADEISAVAYDLRSKFIQSVPWNLRNVDPILRGALIASVVNSVGYLGVDRDKLLGSLGMEELPPYISERVTEALAALVSLDAQKLPGVICTLFGDSQKESYIGGYKGQYPQHQTSPKLDGLYAWLGLLGYEMSAEEKALQDGTHEIFQRDQEETTP